MVKPTDAGSNPAASTSFPRPNPAPQAACTVSCCLVLSRKLPTHYPRQGPGQQTSPASLYGGRPGCRLRFTRRGVEKTGLALVLTAVVGMFVLLSGCSGSSSSGASSDARVPLTAADKQAVAMLGGFGGEWLPHTKDIIRLEQPPPSGANWARAWKSKCRDAFTIYQTTRGQSAEWLAALFVHESQHHIDGCKSGPEWEARANNLTRCWRNGTPRSQCKVWEPQ